jgi:hypothetical protein
LQARPSDFWWEATKFDQTSLQDQLSKKALRRRLGHTVIVDHRHYARRLAAASNHVSRNAATPRFAPQINPQGVCYVRGLRGIHVGSSEMSEDSRPSNMINPTCPPSEARGIFRRRRRVVKPARGCMVETSGGFRATLTVTGLERKIPSISCSCESGRGPRFFP